MFGLGWQELVIILIIALVIFGPKRLPEIGRSLGKGIKEFKKSTTELQEQLTEEDSSANVDKTESSEVPVNEGQKPNPEAKTS